MTETAANETQIDNPELSPTSSIVLANISAVPILLNLSILFVCFGRLKREFHHLLILALCCSEILVGSSYLWHIISSSFDLVNVTSCLMTLYGLIFGMLLTYGFVFLICLQRYLTVKYFNFGINQAFNRFKHVLILAVVFPALLVSVVVFVTPQTSDITVCSPRNLYLDNFAYIVYIFAGTLTLLVLLIITTTLLTSCRIWSIFFKNKNQTVPMTKSTKREESSPPDETDPDIHNQPSCSSDIMQVRTEISPTGKNSTKQEPDSHIYQRRSWEIRAFTTSVTVASTTMLLTGPFVMTFWIDLYSDGSLYQTRLYVFVLCLINYFIDPFLYAWRIEEIREEFKIVFNRCKHAQHNTEQVPGQSE